MQKSGRKMKQQGKQQKLQEKRKKRKKRRLVLAGKRKSGLVGGPMRDAVGWLARSGPLGPNGCGRFKDPRWRCPYS